MAQEIVHIAIAFDEHYAQYGSVVLASVLDNCSDPKRLLIHMVTNGLKRRTKRLLEQFVAQRGARCVVYEFASFEQLKDAPIKQGDHVSIVAYFRILLPVVLDQSIEQVLYLDSDIIVKGDVIQLWGYDVKQYAFGAVDHPKSANDSEHPLYMNSGVMLFNLTYWREKGLVDRVLSYIAKYPERLKTWDQDAINGELPGEWVELPSAWNMVEGWYLDPYVTPEVNGMTQAEFEQLRNSPMLIHYTGAGVRKPWFKQCNHPLKAEYWTYVPLSPLSRKTPIDARSFGYRLRNKIKQYFK